MQLSVTWRGLALVLPLICCPALLAQLTLSTVRGNASDPSGAVVADAAITLQNLETNQKRTATTNQNGDFEIPDLLRGTYRLSASHPGFQTFVAENILLETSQVRRIDITFLLGAVSQEVTVRADAAVITTDTAKIQSGFGSQRYEDTPVVGGPATFDPSLMLTTLPFVQSTDGLWSSEWAGQSSTQVQQGMDGHTNDGAVNQINNMMDVEEIVVSTVNNSAEFSRMGYFNMVGKSGSNQFHGRVLYWHNNSALSARSFFDTVKPKELTHTFSGNASGPLIRNKTFFFASWNGQRIPGKSSRLLTVPTAPMRQGDFSQLSTVIRDPLTGRIGSNNRRDPATGLPFPGNLLPAERVSSVSRIVQQDYMPPPNLGGPNTMNRNFQFLWPYPNDLFSSDFFTERVDHQLTQKNRIYGRFIMNWFRYVLPTNYPAMGWTRVRFNNHLVIEDTHVISSNLVNSFRVGLYKEKITNGETVDGFTPARGDEVVKKIGLQGVNPRGLSGEGFPRMDITGYSTMSTQAGGVTQNDHNWGYAESLTWTKGKHVLKFGGEYKPYSRYIGSIPEGTYGIFTFNGRQTGHAWADFLLGIPSSSRRLDPLFPRTRLDSELGLYVQDAYKLSSRLTLDFGLRWDHFGAATFEDGLVYNLDLATGNVIVPRDALKKISPLYPTNRITVAAGDAVPHPSMRNFGPRVGAAWRPAGQKMVIRGGYGIYTETLGRYSRLNTGGPYELSETFNNYINPDGPYFAFPNPFPSGLGSISSQSITAQPPNTANGHIHQFNATIERQVKDIGLRLSYIGSRNRGMNYTLGINTLPPLAVPVSPDPRPLPYPQFVGVTSTRTNGAQRYNAMSFEVQRKVGQLSFQAHWTWSSNLSNTLSIDNPWAELRWARLPFTTRHRVGGNAVWRIPVGRGRHYLAHAPRVVDHALGGWQLYWIGFMEQGQFFSATSSGYDPNNPLSFGGRPDRICDGNLPPGQRTIDHWFDASCFVPHPPGRYGNSGVNVLEGPGMHQHHVSIIKRFPVTERLNLQFTAAVNNIANHPNFNRPSADISAPATVGTVNSVRQYADHRAIEMRLRLDF